MVFNVAQKYDFVLNSRLIFQSFANGIIHNVVSTLLKLVKLDVENDNIVSTLPKVIHINFETENVGSTLSHVATSYQPKDNVETTLKCLLGKCCMRL